MRAIPSSLRACIQEAGFRIVEDEIWQIRAQHERHTRVVLRADLIQAAVGEWSLKVIQDTGTYGINPANLSELILLLHESYSESARERRNRAA